MSKQKAQAPDAERMSPLGRQPPTSPRWLLAGPWPRLGLGKRPVRQASRLPPGLEPFTEHKLLLCAPSVWLRIVEDLAGQGKGPLGSPLRSVWASCSRARGWRCVCSEGGGLGSGVAPPVWRCSVSATWTKCQRLPHHLCPLSVPAGTGGPASRVPMSESGHKVEWPTQFLQSSWLHFLQLPGRPM